MGQNILKLFTIIVNKKKIFFTLYRLTISFLRYDACVCASIISLLAN